MPNLRRVSSNVKGRRGAGIKANRGAFAGGPPSPGTGVAGPTGTDWSAFNEAPSTGDIIRYQLNDTITYPNKPDGYIWTHMRVAYESPSGIQIEQVPFNIGKGFEHRVRVNPNTSNRVWLQFAAEEADQLQVTNAANFSVSDVITGVTSGASATITAIDLADDILTVTLPSGGDGLFLFNEDLSVGGVTTGRKVADKVGSHASLTAGVHYSEWSDAKTITTTTGSPSVDVTVSTTTPLRDDGVKIQLKPRGFNTLDPRVDLDFQSEITTVSEQGNLVHIPASLNLNHPTNRHIGYTEHHTLSFQGVGSRSVTHTIRNFDNSESATATTTFTVGDPDAESWGVVYDVDETNTFAGGTATGSTTTTSFETARAGAVAQASAWIRVHNTVNSSVSSLDFNTGSLDNLRLEGIGAGAKIEHGGTLETRSMSKATIANIEIDSLIDVTDPLSAPWPDSGIRCSDCVDFSATRTIIRGAIQALLMTGVGCEFKLNDVAVYDPANFGLRGGDGAAILTNGIRVEANIDNPRGETSNLPDYSTSPNFVPHGGTSRMSRPDDLIVYQKGLFFTNMGHGGSYSAPGIGCQPTIRFFGSADGSVGTQRITYCTVQSGNMEIRSTSAGNGVNSHDIIIDGLQALLDTDSGNLFGCDVGGVIFRNSILLMPNTPYNTERLSLRPIISITNSGGTGLNLLGMRNNRWDEIKVYNNHFVQLMDDTNAGKSVDGLTWVDDLGNGASYSVVNNIDHRPNAGTPVVADAPLDTTTTFVSIYTGYLPWDNINEVTLSRRTDLAHTTGGTSGVNTAIYTPTTGSAAVEDATTGYIAIRDITGAFRQDKITARGGTNAYRGAVEGTVTS